MRFWFLSSAVGSGELWTPANTTTGLWFDAGDDSTVTLDGNGRVSDILDKSGNNRDGSQPTSSERPDYLLSSVNGLNVADFISGTAMPFVSFPQASGQHILLAGDTTDIQTGFRAFMERSNATVGDPALHFGSSNETRRPGTFWASVNSVRAPWPTAIQRQAIFMWSLVADGSTATIETNIDAGTPESASFTQPAALSKEWNSITLVGSQQAIFKFYEAVALPSPTTEIIEKAEGYLAHRWGLEANLPSGHPYKNEAPTV